MIVHTFSRAEMAVIDKALADLAALGTHPEDAASLLAVQGIIRVIDRAELIELASLAHEQALACRDCETLQ